MSRMALTPGDSDLSRVTLVEELWRHVDYSERSLCDSKSDLPILGTSKKEVHFFTALTGSFNNKWLQHSFLTIIPYFEFLEVQSFGIE